MIFHYMSAGHQPDSTPESRWCAPILCPLLPCFLYGAGSAPDSNYNSRCTGSQYRQSVARSWLVVRTGETPMMQLSGYRRRCQSSQQIDSSFVRLHLVCNMVESIVLPHTMFRFSKVFRITIGLQQVGPRRVRTAARCCSLRHRAFFRCCAVTRAQH